MIVLDFISWTNWQTWWNQLIAGQIFEAVIASYTSVLGAWFYFLVIFLGMIMIYLKTMNFGTTVLTGIIIAGGFLPFVATLTGYTAALPLIYAMIVLAITGILYKVFKG